jgi:hypothetical protein
MCSVRFTAEIALALQRNSCRCYPSRISSVPRVYDRRFPSLESQIPQSARCDFVKRECHQQRTVENSVGTERSKN